MRNRIIASGSGYLQNFEDTIYSVVLWCGNVEKWVIKMPVRWIGGEYVVTGVDAAIEANRSLAASLDISPVELEKLMKNPALFIKLEPILKTHQGIGIAGALEILLDEIAGQQIEDQNPGSGQIDWNTVDAIIAKVIRSR